MFDIESKVEKMVQGKVGSIIVEKVVNSVTPVFEKLVNKMKEELIADLTRIVDFRVFMLELAKAAEIKRRTSATQDAETRAQNEIIQQLAEQHVQAAALFGVEKLEDEVEDRHGKEFVQDLKNMVDPDKGN